MKYFLFIILILALPLQAMEQEAQNTNTFSRQKGLQLLDELQRHFEPLAKSKEKKKHLIFKAHGQKNKLMGNLILSGSSAGIFILSNLWLNNHANSSFAEKTAHISALGALTFCIKTKDSWDELQETYRELAALDDIS